MAALEEALDALAAVEQDAEVDRDVLDGVGLERAANRLAGLQLRTLGQAGRREAYGLDGAATLASWYRARTTWTTARRPDESTPPTALTGCRG